VPLIKRTDILEIIIPGIITLVIFLVFSQLFYGQFFLGHLHADPHSKQTAFSYVFIPDRLYDYIVSIDRSLFIHMPLFILALPGYKYFHDNFRDEFFL